MKKINIRNPAEVVAGALEHMIKLFEDGEKEMKGRMPPKLIKEKELMMLMLADMTSKDGPYILPNEGQKKEMIDAEKKQLAMLNKHELIDQLANAKIELNLITKQFESSRNAAIYLEEKWMANVNKTIEKGNKIREKKTSDGSHHGKRYQLSISVLNEIRPDKKWKSEDFKVFKRIMERSGNKLEDTPARRYFKKITGLTSTKSIK
jgi:hypothetical protein